MDGLPTFVPAEDCAPSATLGQWAVAPLLLLLLILLLLLLLNLLLLLLLLLPTRDVWNHCRWGRTSLHCS